MPNVSLISFKNSPVCSKEVATAVFASVMFFRLKCLNGFGFPLLF